MPTLTLSPASFSFPVSSPANPPPAKTAGVGVQGVVFTAENPEKIQIPVSLAIGPVSPFLLREHPYTPGVFVAELQQQFLGRNGLTAPQTVASTNGAPGPNATITVTKGETPPVLTLAVSFKPPANPLPGLFEANLAVSGWGGTANVVLSATTAQITAKPSLIGANGVFAPQENQSGFDFQGPFVAVKIDYVSGNDATVNANIAATFVTDNMLIIDGSTISLVPNKTTTVTLEAIVNGTASSGHGTAQLQITVPDDLFLLQPPPIDVDYKYKT
jgi:hypothetical protein